VVSTALARAQAAIILFTPDEHSKLRDELLGTGDSHEERTGGYQPRPNVLVEAGMAFALYPSRTLILQVGPARTISDLAGLNYLAFDGAAPARRALLSRLQAAGCEPRDSEDFYRLPFDYRRP
jgi:predicted nucleotide-binding protein